MQLKLINPMAVEWLAAVDLVRSKYQAVFDADILPNPDNFLALYDDAGELQACCGITYARGNKMFSEQYLDMPIEKAIAANCGEKVERDQVLEVGSLATHSRSAGTELMKMIPVVVWSQGKRYAVLTATSQLARIMRQVGVPAKLIAHASSDRLSDVDREKWGSYYKTNPFVCYVNVGSLSGGFFSKVGTYSFRNIDIEIVSANKEIA
ncbi:thermostable hemolysin [Teredinibacter purpureus]|uniref:thermostable hemolysin n=1 Tax=Teredinibacter purpureus TaxID=2731756 RepID=UPI0005F76A11|nr:thermostable hemolysin [Teredinibacter purpureus]